MLDYHADYSAVSCSMLKLFRRSRVEYNLTYNTRELPPWQPTPPALLGTVLHAMLLENVPLDDLVLCYPQDVLNVNGGLIGKRAAEFRASHPANVFMKEEEYGTIQAGVKAVMGRPEIRDMLAAASHKEHRFDSDLLGLPCKCLVDIAGDLGDYIAIYDLKFSLNVDPESWRRTSRRLAYWAQDAHYSKVLEAKYGKPVRFRFLAIEIKPPFRVQWYWYEPRSREIAFDEHKRLLLALRECQETGVWSDNWESECVINSWDIEAELSPDEVQIDV